MNTLHNIFDWLLAASLRASALTLLVFAIQWLLHRHLSPRWRYALWLPVLIVLLAPVLPESRWSIESVFQAESPPMEIHPIPVLAASMPVSVPHLITPAVSPPTPVDWSQIQLMTWALGALLLLLVGGFSFLRTLLRFQRSRQSVSDDLLSQLEAISQEVGLRSSPRVLVAPAIQSPAVTGLLRPTLLLPAGFERDFTANEARLILQHELTHLKRHDLPLNTLLCVLMALHWFNPLLWLAFFKARADREAACDAQVLADATPQRRSEYGHALLKVEAAFAPLRLSLGFIGMLQRGAALRARIRSIALPSRTRPLAGLLATLCITGMTFLGITRAEKPGAATDDFTGMTFLGGAGAEKPGTLTDGDTTLIAIEVETVRFLKDTTWDFGGRFKQLDPTDNLKVSGEIELLGKKDVSATKEHLRKLAGADIAAYPRMVTKDGAEVMIRSVVNQPVLGGKDSNGKDLIAYLPIGFVGKFTPKAMQDGKVALNIDITDSRIIATETIQGREYPVAASRVYSGPVELQPGLTVAQYAWQGHGWKDGKPQSYRPTVTFITTHVIDPKKGGLPADASKDFSIGHSSFLPGDSIHITQVQRSGGFMTVTADYELASADAANIALFITSTKDNGPTKTDPNQRKAITKGKGRVILHHPDVREGMPHVSFYPTRGGSSFGGIYFGTQAEAEASQKMSAPRAARAASTASGATKFPDTDKTITLNFPDDTVETVIAVYAKLKSKKVRLDPADKSARLKIVAPEPLSHQEAIAFMEAALLLNGFALVEDGPDNLTLRKTDTPQPSVIEAKLRNIILPRVQFSGATIEEAVDYLRVKSREFDTLDKTGVQFILRPGDTKPDRISLDLTNVPLIEALRYCTELAGLTYKVEPYAVTIASTATEVPAKLDITSNETLYDKKTGILTAKGDAKTQFGKMTIQANALIHDPKNQQLQMIAPFVLLMEGTKQITSTDANAVATLDLKTGSLSIQGGHKAQILDAKTTNTTRAGKIILPSVEFRDATLVEAIEFIRAKSRDLDPDKKGVNILLKGDGGTVKITLSLKDVPVSEALHYCAELANYKLSADDSTFVLAPAPPKGAATPLKSSDNDATETDAQAKATELRRAKPQQYDFSKAVLGDVLRFLATDAGINFFALPDDNPINQKLVTFSIRASPFAALESLCRANGAVLVFDQDRWFIRAADDPEQIGKNYVLPPTQASVETIADDPGQIGKGYVLPQTQASVETILKDISSILGGGETKPVAGNPQPSVQFKKEQNSVYVKASRLQHTWVSAYLRGLSSSAQSSNAK